MLILLLPLTTICVSLVGFYAWHRQLVRKRHFEIADAALSAFSRAEAAVAHAREPTMVYGEGSSRKTRDDELPTCSEMLDTLYIPLERLKHYSDAFEELERAAINAEVYFSSDVAHHLREPLRAYNRIATAVICRMSCVGLSDPAQVSPALLRRWETVVFSGGHREVVSADKLSVEMDRAKWKVELARGRTWKRRPSVSSC